ncbi:MAG: endolytic transglycosylase MltG [Methylococcaceae bacterium]
MAFKIIAGVLLTLIIVSGWAWRDFKSALITPAVVGKPVVIEINKGDSFNQIIDKLLVQNVDIKPLWFKVLAVSENAVKKLKTGEYELASGLTLPEILAVFVQGKTKQYAITFPEGWSFKEIVLEIKNNPNLEHALPQVDYNALMFQWGADVKQPAIAPGIALDNCAMGCSTSPVPGVVPPASMQSPEGLFFPDTYFFEKHTTDVALLKRAYDKMQLVLKQEWQDKAEALPFTTPYEALILASIVEKETAVTTERPLIAGVFIRRLQTDMLLQTDPTVIYGMGDSYQGDIAYKDLKAATPYNTYIIKGLPPTPIAMPGRDAIYAVLHPHNSNSLYFVARGDGTHQFSATLKDHNLAVNNFQRKKNAPR